MSETGAQDGRKTVETAAFGTGSFGAALGSAQAERGGLPVAAWGVAALIVIAVAGALVLAGRHKPAVPPNTVQPADAYAASLPLSQLAMSESESLSGGKLTYLDGHIQDAGERTVSGVTVQVVFGNDEGLAPQVDTVPLMLIRTREPYIDTQAVSDNPLKPGEERDFRLIFESIPANWNTQMPEVRIIRTNLR
jgi:Protein of unknown function (DUF2393)